MMIIINIIPKNKCFQECKKMNLYNVAIAVPYVAIILKAQACTLAE